MCVVWQDGREVQKQLEKARGDCSLGPEGETVQVLWKDLQI